MKPQFRVSKPEAKYDSHPKSQFRNPNQCYNSNYQNLNLFNSLVLEIGNYVIWICFESRVSTFVCSWRALWFNFARHPESIAGRLYSSHRLSDSLKPNSTKHFKHAWLGFYLLSNSFAYMRQVIDQEVFSQSIRPGEKGPSLIEVCHLLDELF